MACFVLCPSDGDGLITLRHESSPPVQKPRVGESGVVLCGPGCRSEAVGSFVAASLDASGNCQAASSDCGLPPVARL